MAGPGRSEGLSRGLSPPAHCAQTGQSTGRGMRPLLSRQRGTGAWPRADSSAPWAGPGEPQGIGALGLPPGIAQEEPAPRWPVSRGPARALDALCVCTGLGAGGRPAPSPVRPPSQAASCSRAAAGPGPGPRRRVPTSAYAVRSVPGATAGPLAKPTPGAGRVFLVTGRGAGTGGGGGGRCRGPSAADLLFGNIMDTRPRGDGFSSRAVR